MTIKFTIPWCATISQTLFNKRSILIHYIVCVYIIWIDYTCRVIIHILAESYRHIMAHTHTYIAIAIYTLHDSYSLDLTVLPNSAAWPLWSPPVQPAPVHEGTTPPGQMQSVVVPLSRFHTTPRVHQWPWWPVVLLCTLKSCPVCLCLNRNANSHIYKHGPWGKMSVDYRWLVPPCAWLPCGCWNHDSDLVLKCFKLWKLIKFNQKS